MSDLDGSNRPGSTRRDFLGRWGAAGLVASMAAPSLLGASGGAATAGGAHGGTTAGVTLMGTSSQSDWARVAPTDRDLGIKIKRLADAMPPWSPGQVTDPAGVFADMGATSIMLANWDEPNWPSDAECRDLGGWAAALGPNGWFWTGIRAGQAHLAARWVEFGNELSYTYRQFGAMPGRAQTYARKARIAADAVTAANPGVSLLIDADVANFGAGWLAEMKAAVPDLDQRIGGWVVHPYGSNYLARIQNTVEAIREVGWQCDASKPILVTEYGVFSRDGRCMDANYGWDRCATYQYAADTLTTTVNDMLTRFPIGAFCIYQPRDQKPYADPSTSEHHWAGIVQWNGTPKGPYTTAARGLIANSAHIADHRRLPAANRGVESVRPEESR